MDVLLAAGHKLHFLLGYIDPGTGSMVFQVLAAAILSAGLFFRSLRIAIVQALARVLHIKSKSAGPETAAADAASVGNGADHLSESELRRAA
jgi:hypothetical protein